MQLSLILDKDVIVDGKVCGTLQGVCWQKKHQCYLQIDGNTYSTDKIKVKKGLLAQNLQSAELLPHLFVGKLVYYTDGKLLGKIVDVELTRTLKVKWLVIDNETIVRVSKIVANNDIVTVRVNKPKKEKIPIGVEENTGKNLVVESTVQTEESGEVIQQVVATTDSPLAGQIATQQIVGPMDNQTADQIVAENGATQEPFAQEPTQTHVLPKVEQSTTVTFDTSEKTITFGPRRRSGDFSFLVGKTVDKNIFNFLGELMIREGEIVTREVYLKARHFGKLTELCLHAK